MRYFIGISIFLFVQMFSFAQKDSFYLKKIADPATSLIQLKEGYKIFSQKFGTGKIKLLLLHGGPNNTHEGFEIFVNKLPLDKYTIILYDQLGSYYSDQPNDTTLWNIPRFVEEVEQVRQFYKLDSFYLLGHSWGGLVAMEYALKYPDKLKALIISNKSYSQKNLMTSRRELSEQIAYELKCSSKTLEEIKNGIPVSDTVELKKVSAEFRKRHVVRLDTVPDAINRISQHLTTAKYSKYFHDRETWNILDSLQFIKQPTLLIAGKYDFVKESELVEMKKRIKNSQVYICPNGGHFDFWDDADNYFSALTKFINMTEKKYYR